MATDIFTELENADDNRALTLIDLARSALLYDRSSSSSTTTENGSGTTYDTEASKDSTGRLLIQDEDRLFGILQKRLMVTNYHTITEELLLGILQYYVTVVHTSSSNNNYNNKKNNNSTTTPPTTTDHPQDSLSYIMTVLPSIVSHLGYKNPYIIIEASSTYDRIRRGIGVLLLAILQYHYSCTYSDITKYLVNYGIQSSIDLLSKDTIILCGDIIRNFSSNSNISMVFDWSLLIPSIIQRLYTWDQQILHESSLSDTITILRQCVTTSEKTLGKIYSILHAQGFSHYCYSSSVNLSNDILESLNLHMDNIIQYSIPNSKKLGSPSSVASQSPIKASHDNNNNHHHHHHHHHYRESQETDSKLTDDHVSSTSILPSTVTPVRTSGFLHRHSNDSNSTMSPLMATAEDLSVSSSHPSFTSVTSSTTNVSSPTTLSSLVPPNVMQKLRKSFDATPSVESIDLSSSMDNEDPTIRTAIAERTAAGEQLLTRVLGLSTRTALNLFTNREGQALQELFTLSCSLVRDDTSMRICVIGLGVLDRILYLCGQLGIVNESITLSKSNNRISIEWEEDVWPTIADRLGDERALIRHAAVKTCVSLIWARSLLTSLSSVLGLLKHRNKQTRESAVRVLLHAILQHAALRYENASNESIHIILPQDIRRMIVAIAPLINDTAGRVATVSIEFLSALNTYVAGQDPSQQGIGKLNTAFIDMIREAGIDTSSAEWYSVTSRIELMPSTVPRINTSGYLELPAENASSTVSLTNLRSSLMDKYSKVSPPKENNQSLPPTDNYDGSAYPTQYTSTSSSLSAKGIPRYPSIGVPGQQSRPISTQHGPRLISPDLANDTNGIEDSGLLKFVSYRSSVNGTAATPTSVESMSVHDTPTYPGPGGSSSAGSGGKVHKTSPRKGGHTPISNEYTDSNRIYTENANVPNATLSFMGKLSQALQEKGNTRQGTEGNDADEFTMVSSSPRKGGKGKKNSPARPTDTVTNPHLTVEILENVRQNRVSVGEFHQLVALNGSNRSLKSTGSSTKNSTPEGKNRIPRTSPRKEFNDGDTETGENNTRDQTTPRRKISNPQLVASPMVTSPTNDGSTITTGNGKGYAARHLAQKNLKYPTHYGKTSGNFTPSNVNDRPNEEDSKYSDNESGIPDTDTTVSPSLRSVSANKVSPSKAAHSKYLVEKLEQIYSPPMTKAKASVPMHIGAQTTSVVTRSKTRLIDDTENERTNASLDIPQIATHLNFQDDAKLPIRSPIHAGTGDKKGNATVRNGGSVSASYARDITKLSNDPSILATSTVSAVTDDTGTPPPMDAEEAQAVQSKLDLLKRRSRQTSRIRRTASALPATNSNTTGTNDNSILNSSMDSVGSIEQESKEIESIHTLLRHREHDEQHRNSSLFVNGNDTIKKSSSLVSASSASSNEGKTSDSGSAHTRTNRNGSNGGSGNYLNYRDRLPGSGTNPTANHPSTVTVNKVSSINLKRGPAGSYDSVALNEEFGWDPYAGQPASPAKSLRNTGNGNIFDTPLGIDSMTGLRSGGSAHSDLSDAMVAENGTSSPAVNVGLPGIRTKALSGGNVRSMVHTNNSNNVEQPSLSSMNTIVNQYSFEVQSPPTNEGIVTNKKAYSAGPTQRGNGNNALPPLSSSAVTNLVPTNSGTLYASQNASPIDTPRSLSSHATQNGESGAALSSHNGTDQDSERLSSLSMGEIVPGTSTTPSSSSISGPLGPLRLLSSRMTRSGSRKPQINTEPGMIGTGSGITPRTTNNHGNTTDRTRTHSGNTNTKHYARSENSLSPVSINSTSADNLNGPDTGFTVRNSNNNSTASSRHPHHAPLSPSPSDERPIRPMANAEAFYRTLAAQGDEVKDSVLSLTAGFVSPVDINIYTNAENMKAQTSDSSSVIKLISPTSPPSRGIPQFVNNRANVPTSSSGGGRSPVRPRSIHPNNNNTSSALASNLNDSYASIASLPVPANDSNSVDGDNYQDNSLNNSTNDDNASIGSYGDMNYSDTASIATSGSYTHSLPSNNGGTYYRKRRTVNKLPSIGTATTVNDTKENIAGISGTGYANINQSNSSLLNTSTGSALSGVPSGAPNTEKLYIPTSQLSPLTNPDAAIKTALSTDLLPDSNWEKQFEACNTLRRAAIYHPDSLLSILHSCVMSLLPLCDSLRSSVSKIALMTLADCFRGMGRTMDPELENLLPSVLRRAADTNEFILVAAEEALTNMIMYCSDNRSVSSLLGCASHKNTSIRLKTAIWLDRAVDHAGMKLSGNRDLERIVTIAVKYSQEGLQEVRHAGTRILHRLMKTNIIDERFLARCGVSERIVTKLRESFQRGVPDDPMPLGSSGLSIGIPTSASSEKFDTENYGGFSSESINDSNFSMRSTSPKAFTSMAQKKRMNATVSASNGNETKDEESSMLRTKSRSQSAIRGTTTMNDGSTPRSDGVGGGMAAVRAKSRMRTGTTPANDSFTPTDEGANQGTETINGILSKLVHATDWNDRVNGLKELVVSIKQYQTILSSPSIAIAIADELGQRLNDNNNKVLLTALQCTQTILPLFSNELIDRVALVLLPTLANNLLNNQRTISTLSSGIIDTLMNTNDPSSLLVPMVNIIRNNNYKLKSAMLEKLSTVIPLIYARRGPSLLVRTILPAIFELLDDPKPDIKNNVYEVLNQLTQAVGAESIMDAARTSSLSDKHTEKLRSLVMNGKR